MRKKGNSDKAEADKEQRPIRVQHMFCCLPYMSHRTHWAKATAITLFVKHNVMPTCKYIETKT